MSGKQGLVGFHLTKICQNALLQPLKIQHDTEKKEKWRTQEDSNLWPLPSEQVVRILANPTRSLFFYAIPR
jgi:hypothetical protein